MLEIIVKPAVELTAQEEAQLDETARLAYSGQDAEDLCWSDSHYFVLGKLEGRVVSIVGVLTREILVGDQHMLIGGVGGVATHPDFQRRGYAGALLRRTAEFMCDTLQVPYGLLVCSPERIPYYGSFGWQTMESPMYIHCRGARRLMNGPKMIIPLDEQPWPQGDVDLQGGPW